MKKFLVFFVFLLFFQSGFAQKRIEVNYLTDTQVSSNRNYEFELNTEFTVSETGSASRVRLLNNNHEAGDFIVKILDSSGKQNSETGGSNAWIFSANIEGWTEFEFPFAIPVSKDKTYILSLTKTTDQVNSNESLNSLTYNSYIQNSQKLYAENSGNNLAGNGRFRYVVLIVVNPKLNAGIIGQEQTINFDTQPASLNQLSAPTGGTGTYSYQWQSSSDGIFWTDVIGANQTTYLPPALTMDTWFRLNVTSGNFGTASSNSVLIKVNPKLIVGNIGKDQTICSGAQPASLELVSPPTGGTGTYTYQWQYSQDNTTWTNVIGANLPSYAPPAITENIWYRLSVISGYAVTTNSVLITVIPRLISGTIGNDQAICCNSAPSILVQVSAPTGGTGTYTYQWQTSPDNSSWTNIGGATGVGYTPPVLSSSTYYRSQVTSGSCGTVSSASILITVYGNLTSGTIGSNQSICYNTAPAALTELTVPTGGPGEYTYQWQNSPDNTIWNNIEGATAIGYAPPALTVSTYYRRQVTSGSCGTVNNSPVLITVYTNLTAGTIGTEQSICYNTVPAPLNELTAPTGGSTSYNYQWQSSPDNSTWTSIGGATAAGYAPAALTASTYYRRQVTSGTCGTINSSSILITVYGNLSSGTIGTAQSICFNTAPATLTEMTAPSGGTGNYSYQWQISSDNISWRNINNALQSSYTPPRLTSGTFFRRNVTSGCTENSNSVRISIYPPLNSAQLYDDKTINENTSTTFNIAISGGNPPYSISYSINGDAQPTISNYTSGNEISTGILTEGTYRYLLTSITDINHCNAQSLGTSITITVLSEQVTSLTNKALILVNSASSSYSNYTNYLKPYLDNFGIPYDVCNVNITSLPSFNDYAIIVFGHKDVYSSGYPITRLETAISSGVGLCSFDPHLFDYSSGFNSLISQRSASSNQINISNYSHYVTQYHAPDSFNPSNNVINLLRSLNLIQRSNLIGGIDLASLNSVSLLQVSNYGNGRIVKWSSYDWMFESILGPVYGMDDLIWRGIVWAARKPFVMQGMPPFITMRVDDSDGDGGGVIRNFEWIKICNEFGIIPWCGTFNNNIPQSYIPTLKSLIDNNLATASPHAFGNGFIYFNHDNLPSFDPAANARAARDFYVQNGLRISKYFVPHYYEVSSSALPEIRSMGGEFIGIHMLPDNFYYYPTPWINCAPFRINRDGMSDSRSPVYYSGYLELNGIEFFNCVTEIRDDGGYEWYPDNNVTTTVARGIRHLRRSLNSMVLASLFTHEQFFVPISTANWREILDQITSAISGYNPEYKSMDYAVTYVRAKQNIRITNVTTSLSDIEISYTGDNDLDTKCYLFTNRMAILIPDS